MGYRVSWIARAGRSRDELLRASGRRLTGERHDFPDVGWYLLELCAPGSPDWVLLIADGSEHFLKLEAPTAQALSADGAMIVHFWCSDTVMASEIMCFESGEEVWSVQYDCSDESAQPAFHGQVPEAAFGLLAKLRAKQEESDGGDYLYDLTAEIGRTLTGFRHDTELKLADPLPFQVLGSCEDV